MVEAMSESDDVRKEDYDDIEAYIDDVMGEKPKKGEEKPAKKVKTKPAEKPKTKPTRKKKTAPQSKPLGRITYKSEKTKLDNLISNSAFFGFIDEKTKSDLTKKLNALKSGKSTQEEFDALGQEVDDESKRQAKAKMDAWRKIVQRDGTRSDREKFEEAMQDFQEHDNLTKKYFAFVDAENVVKKYSGKNRRSAC